MKADHLVEKSAEVKADHLVGKTEIQMALSLDRLSAPKKAEMKVKMMDSLSDVC